MSFVLLEIDDFELLWKKNLSPWLLKNKSLSHCAIVAPYTSVLHFLKLKFHQEQCPLAGIQFLTFTQLYRRLNEHFLQKSNTSISELVLALQFFLGDKDPSLCSGLDRYLHANPLHGIHCYQRLRLRGIEKISWPAWDRIQTQFEKFLQKHNLTPPFSFSSASPISQKPLFNSIFCYGWTFLEETLSSLIQLLKIITDEGFLAVYPPKSEVLSKKTQKKTIFNKKSDGIAPSVNISTHFPCCDFWPCNLPIEYCSEIFRQIQIILAENPNSRIGIIGHNENRFLLKELFFLLKQHRILFFNALEDPSNNSLENSIVVYWIQFQLSGRLKDFITFLEAYALYGLESSAQVTNLRTVAQRFMETSLRRDFKSFMGRAQEDLFSKKGLLAPNPYYHLLPERASLCDFYEQVDLILGPLFKPDPWPMPSFAKEKIFSKRTLLSWLKILWQEKQRKTTKTSLFPYAKIQFVSLKEALTQTWTHLLIPQFSPWLKESNSNTLWEQLSQFIPHNPLLKELLDYLPSLCRLPTQSLLLFGEKSALGSIKGIFEGKINIHSLSQQKIPISCISGQDLSLTSALDLKKSIQCTQQAYFSRRDTGTPFGKFDFLIPSTPEDLCFSEKAWENFFNNGASHWYRHGLKVDSIDLPNLWKQRHKIIGLWVLQWLSHHLNTLSPAKTKGKLLNLLKNKAQQTLQKLYESSHQTHPSLFAQNLWEEAHAIASKLALLLPENKDWSQGVQLSEKALHFTDSHLHNLGRLDKLYLQKAFSGFPTIDIDNSGVF